MSLSEKSDFSSENEVRWCPGCGDFAILKAMQNLLPELGVPPEKTVFISGIGCAGRFPYYMNTYGFHTIHGRAPAVATGLKLMRDDLSVWIITGDGDGLSIGANHLLHCLRRDLNVNVLLFNNQIYGLTKGQFSPTTNIGQQTKTSPEGVQDAPLNPTLMALTAGASFVARGLDKDPKQLADILKKAHAHQGASFVEIYQNCNIFNDGVFDAFAIKARRRQHTLTLNAHAPLVFGQEGEQALVQGKQGLVIKPSKESVPLKHNPSNKSLSIQLAQLTHPEYPVPLGVMYQSPKKAQEISQERPLFDSSSLEKLYLGQHSWKA